MPDSSTRPDYLSRVQQTNVFERYREGPTGEVFEETCTVGLVRADCKDFEVPMVLPSQAGNLDAARNRQSGVESIDDIRSCGRQLLSHNSGNDP